MAHAQLAEQKITLEMYFELEKTSEIRHEYYNGEIYAMAGSTLNHNRIVGKLRSLFSHRFLPNGCDVFSENVKLKVSDIYYSYPDVIVTCDARDISGTYVVEHPSIIVEVLSKSSNHTDRVFKLKEYKSIPSLQYYALVSQYDYNVGLYSRLEGSSLWTYDSFTDPGDVVRFNALDFELSLRDIYANIQFAPEA